MSKLKEVKMPPLDGTEFVAAWVSGAGIPCSEMCMVCDGIILVYSDYEEDYINDPSVITYGWEDDLDARYFVVEK
ncbi:MAG: hypothetical protein ACPGUE_11170 [Marinomonas sp.]